MVCLNSFSPPLSISNAKLASQVKVLVEEFHIFLLSSGRISMAGINESNVEYLADGIHSVVSGKY